PSRPFPLQAVTHWPTAGPVQVAILSGQPIIMSEPRISTFLRHAEEFAMRPRRIPEFSFTVALIWALCASLGVHAAEPTRVALLVGVNKYLKPGLPNLSYAEADVQAVSAQLATNGFKTTLLLGSAAGDKQAGREQILAAARKMVENLGKDDLALVMLSG